MKEQATSSNGKQPNRYDFAKATWGKKLFDWSRQDAVGLAMGHDEDAVFAFIAGYDPTQNDTSGFKFLSWICKVIVQDNIKPEYSGKIKENIKTFISVQNRLPADKRDINLLKSAYDLETLVLPYQDGTIVSLSQLKKEEHQQILKETEFLYEGTQGKILIPKTQRAAQFWGRGTKLCVSSTSAHQLHHFGKVDKMGNLVFYITNGIGVSTVIEDDVEKQISYQIKFAGHKESYLRDAKDKVVTEYIPSLYELLLASNQIEFCMQHGSITPINFPPNTYSESFLLEKIKDKLFKLKDIHEEDRTDAICLAAVTQSGWDLADIPEDKRTDALCLVAVTKTGGALEYVPEDKRTDDLCLLAVTQDGRALDSVPKHKRTEELCLIAVKQYAYAVLYVPEDKLTRDICKICISHDFKEFSLIRNIISTKPYFREVMRFAFETLMTDEKVMDKGKSALAFQDVMTAQEKKDILGITIMPPLREKPAHLQRRL